MLNLLPYINFAVDPPPPLADVCNKSSFFGLRPWYYYLPDNKFEGCDIKKFQLLPTDKSPSDVPLVLLAIVDDLLRIGALVAIGFVIYGAIQLVTSQGDPDGAATAQKTITNALIGLVIAIVAATFVSFLGTKLGS